MSKVHASIVQVSNIGSSGASMLVEDCGSVGDGVELTAATPSTLGWAATDSDATQTNQLTAGATVPPVMLAWRIANMGTDDIYVAFGTAPDATVDTATTATTARKGVPAGAIAYFGVSAIGDEVEYVNA